MSEFDSLIEDPDAPIVSEAEKLGLTRAQAIEHGRLFGLSEAAHRNEPKDWADSRIKRAMAYAAWEYDGKPVGNGAEYRKEFGIPEPAQMDARVSLGSDFVERREKR